MSWAWSVFLGRAGRLVSWTAFHSPVHHTHTHTQPSVCNILCLTSSTHNQPLCAFIHRGEIKVYTVCVYSVWKRGKNLNVYKWKNMFAWYECENVLDNLYFRGETPSHTHTVTSNIQTPLRFAGHVVADMNERKAATGCLSRPTTQANVTDRKACSAENISFPQTLWRVLELPD